MSIMDIILGGLVVFLLLWVSEWIASQLPDDDDDDGGYA